MSRSIRIIVFILLAAFALPVLAQTNPGTGGYTPLADIPDLGSPGKNLGESGLPSYLAGLFRLGIGIAGVLAVLMIVYGGIQYMSTDSITGKEEGRRYIGSAIGGLLLALFAWVILYTVNPDLVEFSLDPINIDVKVIKVATFGSKPACAKLNNTFNPAWQWCANTSRRLCTQVAISGYCGVFATPYRTQMACMKANGWCSEDTGSVPVRGPCNPGGAGDNCVAGAYCMNSCRPKPGETISSSCKISEESKILCGSFVAGGPSGVCHKSGGGPVPNCANITGISTKLYRCPGLIGKASLDKCNAICHPKVCVEA